VVCLEHEVKVSVYGCEVSLSLCWYLQMHTFERIESLSVLQGNWCWNQHGDKSLQSAAHTEFVFSVIHYRYVCTLWRPWIYFLFYNPMVYDILTAGSSLITKAHHWTVLRARIIQLTFITFSLIIKWIACCSKIHSIIIIIIINNMFNILGSDPWFPSVITVFFYWPYSINFPMQN